ncbi:MAG: hypothetical protein O2856_08550 [Planctomycetota bacterium]|nr:hypothetical protein [Planctomycetota bacterium]
MDVRHWKQLICFAAKTSLILLGSTAALAGDRPHEQPTRPHMSATCAPNWGFNQTCWSRFPALPPCPGPGCNTVPTGYDNFPSQSMLYVPHDAMISPDTPFASPTYGTAQHPVNVFPALSIPGAEASSPFGHSSPTEFPARPHEHATPSSPDPATSRGLPPLPTPPMPAPGQTSAPSNMIIGPNRQWMLRPVSTSNQSVQAGTRYSIPGQSTMPVQAGTPVKVPMSSMSLTSKFVTNAQSLPVREQMPQQVVRQSPNATYSAHNLQSHPASAATSGGRYGIANAAQHMPVANFAASNSQSSAGRYGSAINPNGPTASRIPVSTASQSRVLSQGTGTTTYRSGRSMPSVPTPVQQVFQPSQLPLMSNYPAFPIEPLRSTP